MTLSSGKRKRDNISRIPGAVSGSGGNCGMIKVHESVVATIVRRAACDVEGVVRIAGSSIVNNIAEIVGSKRMQDRSISVSMDGGRVAIEIAVNIEFGVHLPTVAANIQSSVAKEVQGITGLTVTRVNVVIREMDEIPNGES